MTWREDQRSGGWIDDDQPKAFVGTVSRDMLRVVLPDGRDARVPFDSYRTAMTVWLSSPQKWSDGRLMTDAELARVETQIREAVTSSGWTVSVHAS